MNQSVPYPFIFRSVTLPSREGGGVFALVRSAKHGACRSRAQRIPPGAYQRSQTVRESLLQDVQI